VLLAYVATAFFAHVGWQSPSGDADAGSLRDGLGLSSTAGRIAYGFTPMILDAATSIAIKSGFPYGPITGSA
jgi:hypothetical protein